jgi:hypothetical protein
VLGRTDDPARLVVADARSSERLYDLQLPAPSTRRCASAGRTAPPWQMPPAWARRCRCVLDGATGQERYSGVIEVPRPQKKIEVLSAKERS